MISLLLVLGLGILVWFGPAIAASSPWKDSLLRQATAELPGDLQVDRLSLGWFSTVGLHGVRFQHGSTKSGRSRKPAFTAEKIQLQATLLGLLLDSRHLGSVTIHKPLVRCVVREGGSNWEDVLAELPPADDSQPPLRGRVRVEQGRVEVTNPQGHALAVLEGLQGHVELAGATAPIELELAAALPGNGSQRQIRISGTLASPDEPAHALDAQLIAAPADLLSAVTSRLGLPLEVTGAVTGTARWESSLDAARQTLSISELQGQQIAVSGPLLQGDRLFTQHLEAVGRLELTNGQWTVADSRLNSDLGTIDLKGTLPLAMAQGGLPTRRLPAGTKASATIDLARLANMLPRTLALQSGVQLEGGQVAIELTSLEQGQLLEANLKTASLAARKGEQRFAFPEPVVMDCLIRLGQQAPVVERLKAESSFFQLTGQGDQQQGSAEFVVDLDRFVEQWKQIVDLGEVRLAGNLQAGVQWSYQPRDAASQINVAADLSASKLVCVLPQRLPWFESKLQARLDASVVTRRGEGVVRVERAKVDVAAGSDTLQAALTEAVERPGAETTWPIQMAVLGDAQRWQARLQPIFTLPAGWKLAGQIDAQLTGKAGRGGGQFSELKLEARPLQLSGPNLWLDEPLVRIAARGGWDQNANQLSVEDATWSSTRLGLRVSKTDVRWNPPSMVGVVAGRGELAALAECFQDPRVVAPTRYSGKFDAQFNLQSDGKLTRADGRIDLANLHYARRVLPANQAPQWQTIWQEPQLALTGKASYQGETDRLTLDEARVQTSGDALAIECQGSLTDLARTMNVDLQGRLAYDLDLLSERLGPTWPVRMYGRDEQPFQLRGPLVSVASGEGRNSPLVSDGLTGQFQFGWDALQMYGLQVGKGVVQGQLAQSLLNTRPLDVELSGGRLRAQPQFDLRGSQPVMVLPTGPLIEGCRITPELCRTWLKFVAPLAADATQAEGQFSILLDAPARIPFGDVKKSSLEGKLAVQSGYVGPGPLAKQVLFVADQLQALAKGKPAGRLTGERWLKMNNQQIAIRVADGRVYHQGMILQVDDLTIRTQGSVGFDESLDLIVQFAVPDDWIAQQPALAGLRGQSVSIPVRGTLASPKVDSNVLKQISGSLLQNATGRVIEQQLNRGLQKLFGPQP